MLGDAKVFATGDVLPPFFHQIYFWDARAEDALGRDGHPRVGNDLIPDTGFPRRMWAGGQLEFHAPLKAGISAERTSYCEAVTRKSGRRGPFALIRLRHEMRQSDELCITEWQDLVFRPETDPDITAPEPPQSARNETCSQTVRFSTTSLFRYSALTFNGHRIHYDVDYAKAVEGYSGLVVHGPLLAQLLMLFAETRLGQLSAFQFRATAPLMHFESAELCACGTDLWVRGPDGRQCMTARAETQSI
ncbi:MAG: acyl dehydratase [Pseudomonadota bacterium]